MTNEERDFILEQGLPMDLFFNARGMSVKLFQDKMKEMGKPFAYNTTPCQISRHTIRTRAGHCAVCDTSKIAFMLRHISFGLVYIAGSKKGELIKIGTTSSKDIRSDSLNRTKYGNQIDWEILFYFKCINAGEVENKAQKNLISFAATGLNYHHDNHIQNSKELFRCSYTKAKDALIEAIDGLKLEVMDMTEKINQIDNYNFRTLRKL
jgi:hypothetical protein